MIDVAKTASEELASVREAAAGAIERVGTASGAERSKPYSPVMYVVVRRDLAMPPGKLAAQVAHAAVRCVRAASADPRKASTVAAYFDEQAGNEAKIVVGCDSLEELNRIREETEAMGITCAEVRDAGRTVFAEPTVTCLGVGPVFRYDAAHLKGLGLYR